MAEHSRLCERRMLTVILRDVDMEDLHRYGPVGDAHRALQAAWEDGEKLPSVEMVWTTPDA